MPSLLRVLGPVRAEKDGREILVAGGRQRALLALLVLDANRVVSVDRLVDELWDGEPPTQAHRGVQVLVSRARRDLGDLGTIESEGRGYRLRVDPRETDLGRFELEASAARKAASAGDMRGALAHFDAALAQWTGSALADVRDLPALATHAERLERARLDAEEDRIEARLALGEDIIGECERMVDAQPLRERPRAQLMLALYRAGRQADALAVYRDIARLLDEELGLAPGPALRDLEARILAHDPELGAPLVQSGRRRSRPLLLGAAASIAVLVVAGLVALGAGQDTRRRLVAAPNAVIGIDPASNKITDVIAVGRGPDAVTAAAGALWVVNFQDRTLSRVSPQTHRVVTVGGLPLVDRVVADGVGGLWISSAQHPIVSRLNPSTLTIERRVRVRFAAEGLATGGGFLWVTNPAPSGRPFDDSISAIDLRSMRVTEVVGVRALPLFDTFGYGAAWTSNHDEDNVSVIRAGQAKSETIGVGRGPLGIAAGEGGIWVVNYSGFVTRIAPITRRRVATIKVGAGPLSVAAGLGAVWVTNRDDGTISRIDPRTNRVTATIKFKTNTGPGSTISPFGVTTAYGRVWVTTQSCAAPPCLGAS